jgi:hypothetical protein
MLRICLHPKGWTPQIVNYSEWRHYILGYLKKQTEMTADAFLLDLLHELKCYQKPASLKDKSPTNNAIQSHIAVQLQLFTPEGELSFIGTTTVFGTPIDITLSELAVEVFFPADEKTTETINRIFK